MLTSVIVSVLSPGASVSPYTLNLVNANAMKHQIRDIQGLGPVKADISTTPFGSVDGELYNGSSMGKRNIVFTFGLNPAWSAGESMASMRKDLYTYFMPKRWVNLEFVSTHMPNVQIEGYVESVEPNMFSSDPEIQVSIVCPQPNFVATTPSSVGDVVQTAPGTPATIEYEGTIETGFVLSLASVVPFNGDLTVTNIGLITESLTVTTPATVTATRNFVLSTLQGDKYVRLMTGSVVDHNMLAGMLSGMAWPKLVPGDNQFIVTADPSGVYPMPDSPWSMSYLAQYGGI